MNKYFKNTIFAKYGLAFALTLFAAIAFTGQAATADKKPAASGSDKTNVAKDEKKSSDKENDDKKIDKKESKNQKKEKKDDKKKPTKEEKEEPADDKEDALNAEEKNGTDDAMVDEFLKDAEEGTKDKDIDVTIEKDAQFEEETPKTPKEYTYTLDKIIQMALENSHQIKAAKFGVDVAEEQKSMAIGGYLPKFTVSAYIAPSPSYEKPKSGMTADEFWAYNPSQFNIDSVTMGTEIKGVLPVYTFGKLESAYDLASLGVEMARLEEIKTRSDVIYQAAKAYYTVQFIDDMLDVLKEGLSVAKDSRVKLLDMLKDKAQTSSKIDLYKLDLIIAELEMRIQSAEKWNRMINAAVRVLLGLKPDSPFYLAATTLKKVSFAAESYETYLQYAGVMRPDFRMLELGELLYDKKSSLSLSKMLPNLFIAGWFNVSYTPGAYDPSNPYLSDSFNNLGAGVLLGLKWEFDPMINIMEWKKTKSEKLKFQETKNYAQLGIQLDIREAYEGVKQKEKEVATNYAGLKAGKSWLVSESMNYSVGLAQASDLVEAIGGFAKTQLYYYQSVYDYNVSVLNLEHAIGKDLTKATGGN